MEHSEFNQESTREVPVVVQEALEYMKQVALSQVDMNVSNPRVKDQDPATPTQVNAIRDLIKSVRNQAIKFGIDGKDGFGQPVRNIREDDYSVISSVPGPKIGSGRLLNATGYFMDDLGADITFNYFQGGASTNGSYEVDVNFGEGPVDAKPLMYESGRKKGEDVERKEYEVISYALGRVLESLKLPRYNPSLKASQSGSGPQNPQ